MELNGAMLADFSFGIWTFLAYFGCAMFAAHATID
jgi:hypothetical protein